MGVIGSSFVCVGQSSVLGKWYTLGLVLQVGAYHIGILVIRGGSNLDSPWLDLHCFLCFYGEAFTDCSTFITGTFCFS